MNADHIPVLADDVARVASSYRRLVDCTVGGGGHTARLLEGGGEVLAIDRDPEAVARARARLPSDRVRWRIGRFADPDVLEAIRAFRPDFVLYDLGVSTDHLDDDARGFSFRPGVPLDMRMTPGIGPSAADLLNHRSTRDLADMFSTFGDEPRARALASAVVRRRSTKPFTISDDLVGAIRAALGPRTGPAHFARLFQAVRIAVNDELRQLETALPAARDAVAAGGAVAVISYHSGEDRTVKQLFRKWSTACICPPRAPVCTCRGRALGRADPKRPIRPSPAEIARNPRSRSARLRVFYRADAT